MHGGPTAPNDDASVRLDRLGREAAADDMHLDLQVLQWLLEVHLNLPPEALGGMNDFQALDSVLPHPTAEILKEVEASGFD